MFLDNLVRYLLKRNLSLLKELILEKKQMALRKQIGTPWKIVSTGRKFDEKIMSTKIYTI